MNDMINNIIKTELSFPEVFANFEKREWGVLFYDCNNKLSHDSNHAILYSEKLFNIDSILEEIKIFYESKGIVARIYHPFINGFLQKYQETFYEQGFNVEIYDNCQYMILNSKNKITSSIRLSIKLLKSWDERVAKDILLPNKAEYEIEVIKKSIENKNYCLFVGYLDNRAVTMASLYYSKHNCVRLDGVQTAMAYRNKGYTKELISHIVEYHKRISKATFYLWADNPIAQNIYIQAGFTRIPIQYESWTLFIKEDEYR